MELIEDAGTQGTRLACFDLETDMHERDRAVEPHNLNAILSIIPVD